MDQLKLRPPEVHELPLSAAALACGCPSAASRPPDTKVGKYIMEVPGPSKGCQMVPKGCQLFTIPLRLIRPFWKVLVYGNKMK